MRLLRITTASITGAIDSSSSSKNVVHSNAFGFLTRRKEA
jgi:hypothetical protein